MAPFGDVPFAFVKSLVIVRINDGVFSLREPDPAERVAVTQLSVPEHRQRGRNFQPVRNPDFDDELGDLFNPTPLYGM